MSLTGSTDEFPIIIVGGGLIGVSTLYELVSRGEKAVLLEAGDCVAGETSFANGGMLTPSMPDPWNGPGVAGHLLESLFDPRSSLKLRWKAIPGLTFWGLKFLRHSSTKRHGATTDANYQLAANSTELTNDLRKVLGLDYDFSDRGTLKVFETEEAMEGPLALARRLQSFGLKFEALNRDATVAVEPQLANIKDRIAGALRFPNDRVGDARKFTEALAESALKAGGQIRYNTRVDRIRREGGRISGVVVGDEHLSARAVILAAGTGTVQLARPLGIRLPIAPAKGYSYTVDARSLGDRMPRVPVIDDAMHAAVVPLGDRLRFVGTAEFTGFDPRIDPVRIDNLKSLFQRMYTHLSGDIDIDDGKAWAGFRPMSADGRPFIGPSPVDGLWLNCGHGHLGWTKAVGSARLLVDQMLGTDTLIDPAPFRFDRSA